MDYQSMMSWLAWFNWPVIFVVWIGVGVVVALLLGAVIEKMDR